MPEGKEHKLLYNACSFRCNGQVAREEYPSTEGAPESPGPIF